VRIEKRVLIILAGIGILGVLMYLYGVPLITAGEMGSHVIGMVIP